MARVAYAQAARLALLLARRSVASARRASARRAQTAARGISLVSDADENNCLRAKVRKYPPSSQTQVCSKTAAKMLLVQLVAICALGLVGAAGGARALAAADSCHLREFDLCMTSAIVFVQQPAGTKIGEAEIERQCNLFQETETCLDEYSDRCMTSMQNSLVEFMSGGILKQMRDYCTKGSQLRKTYLKHGDCVNKQRKASNKCLVDFQAAIEKSTQDNTHWKDRPKTLCCALDRLGDCNNKILEPACGKEAVEIGNMLIRGTFSRAATLTCDKYKFESAECKRLLPPPDTKPKGAKSNSVLSKLISTITQV